MPHKRVDITQDDMALRHLSGCEYKVLNYIVNRADSRGVCFPTLETIANATGYNYRHVLRAMERLEVNAVIGYHRKNENDPITSRKLPNVYQVNPDYISLAVENVLESRRLWKMLIDRCAVSMRLWSHINQQPTPVSQFHKTTPEISMPLNNTNNQRSALKDENQTATAYPNDFQIPEGQDAKTEKHKDGQEDNKQRNAHGNERTKSSAAREKYHNPSPIGTNLPDPLHESLAFEVRKLGIPMPLARGIVMEYGIERTNLALQSTAAMGSDAKNPAGLFRSIVQNGLTDEVAVARQQMNKLFRS